MNTKIAEGARTITAVAGMIYRRNNSSDTPILSVKPAFKRSRNPRAEQSSRAGRLSILVEAPRLRRRVSVADAGGAWN